MKPDGGLTVVEQVEWRDAERRLDIMEEQGRRALIEGWRAAQIGVRLSDPLTLEKLGLVPASSIIESAPADALIDPRRHG